MSTAQWLYVGLLVIYSVIFLFFGRLFYWKHYAQKRYYSRRPIGLSESVLENLAHEQGREIPRFSIFIPARNEADVIERTIEHLTTLRYSHRHYEILVVTDEKEAQAASLERAEIAAALLPFLEGQAPWPEKEKHETVLLSLLSKFALEEVDLAERKAHSRLSFRDLLTLAPHHRHEILLETALALVRDMGKIDRRQICETIRRRLPRCSLGQVSRLYPEFLSLAIPMVIAASELKRQESDLLLTRLMTEAAHARQPLTQKVLATLSETLSNRILRRVQSMPPDRLAAWLTRACAEAMPTTQEVVERKRREFARQHDLPALKHVIVPWDFDGQINGVCTGHFVPSTKGRALNYAFRCADDRCNMWGFYDAESRPDRDVLLYVAWRRLIDGDKFQIAQGPVYQIRNFWQIGPLCKIAGLFQAVSHEWQIPYLLKMIPLIGGTNVFATRNLLLQIGGFDHTVLTEDMELGVRAWLVGNAWPEFLPYASSEQTPPTLRAFFRQRLRWGSGYLQVYDKIKSDNSLPIRKKERLLRTYWWQGHFSWVLFQIIALLPFGVLFLRLNNLLDPSAVPSFMNNLFAWFSPFYLLFTFYCFFHYYHYMDKVPTFRRLAGLAQLFVLPVSAFFLPVPYSSALFLKWMGRQPTSWVKTPRTKE